MTRAGQTSPAAGAPDADPSMEDILASIRRILNDDETAPTEASPAEDVFELDRSMIIDDSLEPDHTQAAHEAPETPPMAHAAFDHEHEAEGESLVAPATAAAAGASMGALVRVLGQRHTQVHRGGPTLEDIVRDELRPLVKNWLDENLAAMVERMVRLEIERVTGRNL